MPGSPLCRHFDIRIILRSKTIYIKVQTHRGSIQIATYNKSGLNTTKHTHRTAPQLNFAILLILTCSF
jgi:hypothetical protein